MFAEAAAKSMNRRVTPATYHKGRNHSLLRKTLLACILNFGFAASVVADDFDRLQAVAQSEGRVSVIVTGWQALSGDSDSALDTPGGSNYETLDGDDFVQELRERGASISNVRTFSLLPIVAMSVDAASVQTVKDAGDDIEMFEDTKMSFQLAESGRMLSVGQATKSGYTGKGTVVVVMDTGIDASHPFFQDRVIGEICISDKCPNGKNAMIGAGAAKPFSDRPGYHHGTHVAGISVGKGEQFSGVAPEAKVIAINLQLSNGGLSSTSALSALEAVYSLVTEQKIPVASVNMSFGSACRNDKIKQYYETLATKLREVNVALVAATGNSGKKNGIMRPSCAQGVVSVGAIDKEWAVTPYSNSSELLDLLAPGGNTSVSKNGGILSAVPDAKFDYLQGTSMASPQVAGAFAVLRQAAPAASVDQLLAALKASGRPVSDRNGVSRPAIDLLAALKHLGIDPKKPGNSKPGTPERRPVSGKPPATPTPEQPPEKKDKDWQPL